MKKALPFLIVLCMSLPVFSQLNKEQQLIKQTFFSFLKFYQKNENAFGRFDLYQGTGPEDGPPYKINWKETEKGKWKMADNVYPEDVEENTEN